MWFLMSLQGGREYEKRNQINYPHQQVKTSLLLTFHWPEAAQSPTSIYGDWEI